MMVVFEASIHCTLDGRADIDIHRRARSTPSFPLPCEEKAEKCEDRTAVDGEIGRDIFNVCSVEGMFCKQAVWLFRRHQANFLLPVFVMVLSCHKANTAHRADFLLRCLVAKEQCLEYMNLKFSPFLAPPSSTAVIPPFSPLNRCKEFLPSFLSDEADKHGSS